MPSPEILKDLLERVRGLYVGMLDADEMELFNEACASGLAYRDFDHAGAILGLAKVGLLSQHSIKE